MSTDDDDDKLLEMIFFPISSAKSLKSFTNFSLSSLRTRGRLLLLCLRGFAIALKMTAESVVVE